MNVTPVTYLPVPIIRPVAKVSRSLSDPVEIDPASERHNDGQGSGKSSQRGARRGSRQRTAPVPSDPKAPLSRTLALLAVRRAFGDDG